MTLENQQLHLENESLRTEVAGLRAREAALTEAARELIESAGSSDDDESCVLAVVDGGPFDRLKALVAGAPDPAPGQPVSILYTNLRGETGRRRILPKSLRFAATEWHPEPQWLIEAWDCDKGADRSFALRDIRAWGLPDGEAD